MIDPTTNRPDLVVTIPATDLSLDHRHIEGRSQIEFRNQLARLVEDRTGKWARVHVEPDAEHTIAARSGDTLPLAVISSVDTVLDELLADPDRWRRAQFWDYDVNWTDTDRYGGTAHWGAHALPYTAVTHCEPFVMLVGVHFEGEPKRSWYRCRLPREWPHETTGFHVVENAVKRHLLKRWPEGRDGIA